MKTSIAQQQDPTPGMWQVKPAAPAQRISITELPTREEKIAITFVAVNAPKAKSKARATAKRAKAKTRS